MEKYPDNLDDEILNKIKDQENQILTDFFTNNEAIRKDKYGYSYLYHCL